MDALIEKHPNKIAAVIGLVVLGLVYWRLMPTLPTVMQDELVYMIQSRHTHPSESQFPNYFYSLIYSSSLFAGVDYYWYVKLLNFIFLFGFGGVIFRLSKEVFGFWISILLAVTSVAGPASLYGSIFMPEAMYMFFAALTFYSILRIPVSGFKESWRLFLFSSLLLALTSLIKPHALLLMLGMALFLLFSSKWRQILFSERLLVTATFVVSTISLKLLGGLLLAGPSGMTLFGGYGSVGGVIERLLNLADNSEAGDSGSSEVEGLAEQVSQNVGFVEATFQQFGLHFIAIGFLLAPAWYVFFSTKFSVKSPLAELGLMTLGTMMILISAFGAYVTVTGDDHSDRILLRYYEFLIPLIFLGAFHVLKIRRPTGPPKFIFFGVFLVSTVVIAANGIVDAEMKLSDSSYLLGIFENLDILWLYSGAIVVALLIILGSPTKLKEYVAVTVAISTVFVGYSSQQRQLDQNSIPIGSDFAGQFIRDDLEGVPGEEIFVIGSDKQLVEASIFWMDRPGVKFELYQEGSLIPITEIPEGKNVIVQVLGVRLESLEDDDFIGSDFIISWR